MGIFDHIDPTLKDVYDEARQLAPEVVERESPFSLFLRSENMNELRAASKLATYWKYRRELFGSRALRPLLDLTGDGALDDNGISVLRMGCVVALPNDDKGRKVICLDDLRCKSTSESIRMHCWFYFLVAAAVQRSGKMEQELVIILIRGSNHEFDYGRFFVMVHEAIPIKVCNIHCCFLQSVQDLRSNYVSYLSTFLRQIFKNADNNFVWIHTKHENENHCLSLQEHGLRRMNLPTTLGGSWLYLSFQADIDKESAKQRRMAQSNESAGKTVEKVISNERRIKKRKTDVAYARKRRRNDKSLEMNLKQQCLVLAQNHDRLRQENANLLQAMEAVKKIENMVQASRVAALTIPPTFNILQHNIATNSSGPNWNSTLSAMLAEHQQRNNWNPLLAQNQQRQSTDVSSTDVFSSNEKQKLQQLYSHIYLSSLSASKFGSATPNHSGNLAHPTQIVTAPNPQSGSARNNEQPPQHTLDEAQRLLQLMGQQHHQYQYHNNNTGIGADASSTAIDSSTRPFQNQPVVVPTPTTAMVTTEVPPSLIQRSFNPVAVVPDTTTRQPQSSKIPKGPIHPELRNKNDAITGKER